MGSAVQRFWSANHTLLAADWACYDETLEIDCRHEPASTGISRVRDLP
ncbi:MAG: hypothetical protein PVI78_08560 [Anaerolineales bacterium]|jgi:hypothetical protein